MSKIILASDFSIDIKDYANQGNSDIGIRGSGKTYTATKKAEGLIENGIPIYVFDPTGVWQNLRFGVNGEEGFPVIVAGGRKGDIELTDKNAVKILELALGERVSVIFDFMGRQTGTKTKQLYIVSECIEYLSYNNKGLSHVFIEEAAEFVPQRPYPGGQLCYSRIESMARQGRNYGLGYTLINQRPEEIAKAVFEICETVFIHRQSGKNSLKSVADWLRYKGKDPAEIVNSLPHLQNGQCWVIGQHGEQLITVLPKQSYHPNPKDDFKPDLSESKRNPDLQNFIELARSLNTEVKRREIASAVPDQTAKELQALRDINTFLKNENQELKTALNDATVRLEKIKSIIDLKGQFMEFAPEYSKGGFDNGSSIKIVSVDDFNKIPITNIRVDEARSNAPDRKKYSPAVFINEAEPPTKLPGGALRILEAAAMFHPGPISKTRIAIIADLSVKASTIGVYIADLKKRNFIKQEGQSFWITEDGLLAVPEIKKLPSGEDLVNMWCERVGNGNGASRILRYLFKLYPEGAEKADITEEVGLSANASTFGVYISQLLNFELIERIGKLYKASTELF